jgi:hypothetical protein
MEQYCRRDPIVRKHIDSIISDRSKGVEYLLRSSHLSVPLVSQLVCDFVNRRAQDVEWLRHCLNMSTAMSTAAPRPPRLERVQFGGQTFALPRIETNFTDSGQSTAHIKEYNNEVEKGRFNYAPNDGRVDCAICSEKPRF